MFRLDGRKALVTGASGGIGQEIVKALLNQGAKLAISGSNNQKLEEFANKLEEPVFTFECDLRNKESVNQLVSKASEALDGLDILICNAGITKDNLALRMKDEDFEDVLQVNLNSTFILNRSAIKLMMKNRFGRIINISSVVGFMGNAGQANYTASKAGLVAMSKSLAAEVASRNITINCIAPGFIETPMTQKLSDDQKDMILKMIPVNRMGSAKDIASGVIYLASDEASYITGASLHINGGMYMA